MPAVEPSQPGSHEMSDPKNGASENLWFKLIWACKPWGFGAHCHVILLRVLCRVCPLSQSDTDEARRDTDVDDRATFFSKRLKRGTNRLMEPGAQRSLTVLLATSSELERFTCMLMEEAHGERMNPTRSPKSILRRLVSNDRAELVTVAKTFSSLLDYFYFFPPLL